MINEEVKACDNKKHEKINASYAQIVVGDILAEPYFELLYFNLEDNRWHVGFGSFCLYQVGNWLQEYFNPTYKRVDTAVTDIQDREKVLHDVISILNRQLDEEKQVTQNVIDDFIDYVTRGSRIAAQYCANCCSDCVNGYEWYCGNNKACKGFYPEAAKKEE